MRRVKKYKWLPPLLAICGVAFYVWDGLQMNSWIKNLPNLIIYAVIIMALWWALRKKEKLNQKYSES